MNTRFLTKVIIAFILGTITFTTETIAQNSVSILSPKASSIIKYGEYPVSLYTGLIDITVPIYTIESGSIKVPIELKYHASGIRFDDVSMEAGLGWNLIAGGTIVGSTRGLLDGNGAFTAKDVSLIEPCNSITTTSDYSLLRSVENGRRDYLQRDGSIPRQDGEIDMYSFNFLNHSGSVCFPPLGSEVYRDTLAIDDPSSGLFIPANGLKVSARPGSTFGILDADGVSYSFVRYNRGGDPEPRSSEFYLTQIVSADKVDTVTFEYVDFGISFGGMRRPFFNSTGTRLHRSGIGMAGQEITYSKSGGLYYEYPSPPRLEKIRFKSGVVSFQYNEQDVVNHWNLQSIKVHAKGRLGSNEAIRTVVLSKTKFSNNEDKLDEVAFSSSDGSDSYSYKFEYDGQPGSGIDYWGYANGSSMQNFVPNLFSLPQIPTTNREPNESIMKRGTLNKIIYPTKGFTKFSYEAHRGRYSLNDPLRIYGGLRIKAVESYTPDGQLAEKKWYTYSDGITNGYPELANFLKESYSYEIYYGPSELFNPYITSAITTYLSSPNVNLAVSGGSHVVYGNVKEYVGNASDDYGYTNYSYAVYPDERPYTQGDTYRQNTHDMHVRNNSWRSGKLLSKQVHKKVNDSTYELVYALNNTYKEINKGEYRNLRVFSYMNFTYNPNHLISSMPDIIRDFCRHGQYHMGQNKTPFDYFNYYTTTGLQVLSSSAEYTDGAWNYTYYDSYNISGLPTRVNRITSSGDSLTSMYKYPVDLTGNVYANMKSRNILTPVIEERTYKNGVDFLQKNTTNYKLWYSAFYAPENQQIQYEDGSSKIQAVYNYNNGGNIQEIVNNNAEKKVYLWGYNGQYPVAMIENATSDQVKSAMGGAIPNLGAGTLSASQVAALRNIAGAMVTIYTYSPLIGMTSQTDPRGVTEFYEYDSFGRLSIIKDFEGNILKTYCYNYAGQQVDCFTDPVIYKNVLKSQTFQKNNCPTGQTGSSVIYTVPAGTYTSTVSQEDADQQAQSDINANGQSYANQQGSCTPSFSTLTLHNNSNLVPTGVVIRLWQGGVQVRALAFPLTAGGSTVYSDIPAGVYRVDTSIGSGNPAQYTFRIPSWGTGGFGTSLVGNGSFGDIPLSGGASLQILCERSPGY